MQSPVSTKMNSLLVTYRVFTPQSLKYVQGPYSHMESILR